MENTQVTVPAIGSVWFVKDINDRYVIQDILLRNIGLVVSLRKENATREWFYSLEFFTKHFTKVPKEPTLQELMEAHAKAQARFQKAKDAEQFAQFALTNARQYVREVELELDKARRDHYYFVDTLVLDRSKELEAES